MAHCHYIKINYKLTIIFLGDALYGHIINVAKVLSSLPVSPLTITKLIRQEHETALKS